jgi:hypothetical protein
MLSAIYFNNKAQVVASKISKIGTDRHLPPKMLIFKRSLPQSLP